MKERKRKKKIKEAIKNILLMLLFSGMFGLMLAYGLLHATTLQ